MGAHKREKASPQADRGYMAHQVLASMGRYRLTMYRGVNVLATGMVRQVTTDHVPTAAPEDGGSTLAVHFEDGATIPLEQATAVKRAGD